MQLTPATQWSQEQLEAAEYDLGTLVGPSLSGKALTLYRMLSESWWTGGLIHSFSIERNGVPKFMQLEIPEAPQYCGVPPTPDHNPEGTVPVEDAASPAARVRAALAALGVDESGRGRLEGVYPSSTAAQRPGILDYHAAYSSGDVSPVGVAEAIILFLEGEKRAANWVSELKPEHLRAQAAASAARYASGSPLSVLDGVPFGVKDALDAYPYKSGHGTTFLGDMCGPVSDVTQEAPAVAALRSLGAMCVGKTQMQEFGVLPTGISPKLGLARNPHNPQCIPGGSSGGSACVVAAGVCPFALGTDGGGSVRIPATLCGVVGLKPTQGRMAGDPENCALVTMGPLANSVQDAMIVYAAIACPGSCTRSPLLQAPSTTSSPSPSPPATSTTAVVDGSSSSSAVAAQVGAVTAAGVQAEMAAAAAAVKAAAAAPTPEPSMGENVRTRPPLMLPTGVWPPGVRGVGEGLVDAKPLAGLRVGVYRPWFDHADSAIVKACRNGLDLMTQLGARVVDIILPELELMRVASSIIILTELFVINRHLWDVPELRNRMNEDTRILMALASRLLGAHYIQALRIRRRQTAHWQRAFQSCDVVATPATACTAPLFAPGAETAGAMHLPTTAKLLRYSIVANMLGLPALVLPMGLVDPTPTTASGTTTSTASASSSSTGGIGRLPASLQLIGQPWQEAVLLRIGCLLEAAQRAAGVPAPLPPLVISNPVAKVYSTA